MGGLTRTERLVIASIVVATALAGIAHYADWAPLLAFAVATLALAGLAYVVSLATEQVGERFGPAATGLLQSTLGNLPELFVVIFALRAGEVVVAQTSIVGSIFANALLVLGLVIVLGARNAPDGTMRFSARLPNDTATLLLVTSFIIVLVGLAHATHEPAARHEREVSAIAAVVPARRLPGVGGSLRARRGGGRARGATALRAWRWACRSRLLAAGGVGAAFVSDWFIAALRPTIDQLGVSEAFAGLVVVAHRRQRGRERGRAGARPQGPGRPRDLGRQELGGADRGLPVPGAGAHLAALRPPAHLRARAGADRRAAAHGAVGLADHRRRRGGGLRGLGAGGACT